MKCQILFSGKNKKNISKCRLLKILPRVLSVKECFSFGVLFAIIFVFCVVKIDLKEKVFSAFEQNITTAV